MAKEPAVKGVFPPQWYKYWGPGGGGGNLIAWNTPGDFLRCVKAIQAKVAEHGHEMSDMEAKGLCNHLHTKFTGGPPGHGSAEPPARKGKH